MSHDGSDCFDSMDSTTNTLKPTCHLDADMGADFYLSGRSDQSAKDWMSEAWTFPVADLEKISKSMTLT